MARTIEMMWTLAQSSSGLGGVLKFFGLSPTMLLIIVVGLVVAIGAWWLVKFIYKHREKAKELTLVRRMFASTSGGPAAGADPAKRAAIDNMRRSFEEGVEKFRAAGKNVYTLPWVLLAGPSGSGKTEAIRHCNVGFPPGLQNYLQGAGGTLNMHWWFTNDAVILDTAGRIFMESAGQGGGDEWRELLKMLKDVRPLCPVNGMLLCIGVDSLIKDSGDDIQEKAGKIAQQLDTIQRMLDVRFPVFVVVTKCDLITGFREFFESVTDPALQHQMMGWSNPAALDTVFNPEQVSEHIESVRQRLLRRRYALTIDPIHTDDTQARRTDQVDALYALPDSLARLSSRLRRYLELIFVQGEWSPKPLFLRGIYFTSSMRQGAELDEELAKMLGVGVDKLPGGVSEEKSYFLRDVFKEKVFKEKGLVTRATNVDKQQARQRLMVVGSAIAAAVVLLGLTLFSSYSFRKEIGQKEESWRTLWGGMADLAPVGLGSGAGATPVYREGKDIKFGLEGEFNRAGAVARSRELAENPPSVPILLKPMDLLGMISKGSLSGQLKDASAALVERSVLAPMIEQSRKTMVVEGSGARAWDEAATRTLAGLIRLERGTTGSSLKDDLTALTKGTSNPGVMAEPLDVSALAQYVLPAAEFDKAKPDLENLQSLVSWTYDQGAGKWPPVALGKDAKPIAAGAKAFIEYWKSPEKRSEKLRLVGEVVESLAAFEKAEKDLSDKLAAWKANPPKSLKGERGYETFVEDWNGVYAALAAAQARVSKAMEASKFDSATLEATLKDAETQLRQQAEGAYALVLGAPSAGAATASTSTTTGVAAVDQADAKAKDAANKAQALLAMANSPWPEDIKTVKTALETSRDELFSRGLSAQLQRIREYLGESGAGAKLLAKVGDARVYQARARAYELADASLKVEAPKPLWGELSTAGAGVDTKLSDLRNQINQATSSLSPSNAKENAEFVVQMGARGAKTAMVAAALVGTSGDVGWVKKRVTELVKNWPKDAKPVVAPDRMERKLTIPRVLLSLEPPAEFNPNGAALVLEDHALVAKQANADLLKDADLERGVGAVKVAMNSYRVEYVGEWTEKRRDAAIPAGSESWDATVADMRKLGQDGTTVCDQLTSLSELMYDALGIPGLADEGSPEKKSVDAWREALSTDKASMKSDTYRKEVVQGVRNHYAAMDQDPVKARLAIGSRSSADFTGEFLAALTNESLENSRVAGPGVVYWSQVRLEFFRALTKSYFSASGRVDFSQIGQFPLRFDPGLPGGAALDAEQVQRASEALPGVSKAANSGGGATIRDGAKTGVKAIDEELSKLFKPNEFLAERKELRDALQAWCDWLVQSPTVTIFAIEDHGYVASREQDILRSAEGRDATIAGAIYTQLLVNQEPATNRDGGKAMARKLPVFAGGAAKLEIKMEDGAGRTAAWSPKTAWQTLELLCQNGAQPAGQNWNPAEDADGPSKRWLVPVFFKGQDGKEYFIRVGLEFSVEVPSKKKWPTGDKWK